jgi:hypothetical protein
MERCRGDSQCAGQNHFVSADPNPLLFCHARNVDSFFFRAPGMTLNQRMCNQIPHNAVLKLLSAEALCGSIPFPAICGQVARLIGGAEVWRVRLENLDERIRKASRTEVEDALQDLVQHTGDHCSTQS